MISESDPHRSPLFVPLCRRRNSNTDSTPSLPSFEPSQDESARRDSGRQRVRRNERGREMIRFEALSKHPELFIWGWRHRWGCSAAAMERQGRQGSLLTRCIEMRECVHQIDPPFLAPQSHGTAGGRGWGATLAVAVHEYLHRHLAVIFGRSGRDSERARE